MRLTLVNHACVKIETDGLCLLCDPWLAGSAFNEGWRLLTPTPLSPEAVMDGVTHIWLSHEHPDHFSPPFLSAIARTHAPRVEVVFQKTRDGRVRGFCESRGFKVREVADGETLLIAGTQIRIGAVSPYDSWLWCADASHSLLNLNDCVLARPADLAPIHRLVGEPEVLLTQFSYAAWKGGRDNLAFRREAAAQKLETIRTQAQVLKPRAVIPFASFAYFAHVENAHLNDGVNTPLAAARTIEAEGRTPVILYPGDAWRVGEAHDNGPALAAFDALYRQVPTLPLTVPASPIALADLQERFAAWQKRIFVRNSPLLIAIVRRVPLLGVFAPVTIRLTDLGETITVSLVDGFCASDADPEVEMSSPSLAFIFDHEFGFDTLTVNGRFEASAAGFGRLTRAFGIGSLNAMGIAFSWSILAHHKVMMRLLRTLWRVTARLRTQGTGPLEV